MRSLREVFNSSRQIFREAPQARSLRRLPENEIEVRSDELEADGKHHRFTAADNPETKRAVEGCRYCGKIHDSKSICAGFSRRKFFFLAGMGIAGIGFGKIELAPFPSSKSHLPHMLRGIPFSEIISLEMNRIMGIVPDLFTRDDLFYKQLNSVKTKNVTLMDR